MVHPMAVASVAVAVAVSSYGSHPMRTWMLVAAIMFVGISAQVVYAGMRGDMEGSTGFLPQECQHQGHVELLAIRGKQLLVDTWTGEQVALDSSGPCTLGFDGSGAGWVEAGGSSEWMSSIFKHTLFFDAGSQKHMVMARGTDELEWYSEFMSKTTPISVTLPGFAEPLPCFNMAHANWGARLWWSGKAVAKAVYGCGGGLGKRIRALAKSLRLLGMDARHFRRGFQSTLDNRDVMACDETSGQEAWIP